jgi:hypothetical protein
MVKVLVVLHFYQNKSLHYGHAPLAKQIVIRP